MEHLYQQGRLNQHTREVIRSICLTEEDLNWFFKKMLMLLAEMEVLSLMNLST